jgi:hypothetical protein
VSQPTFHYGLRSSFWCCVPAWSFEHKSLLGHVNQVLWESPSDFYHYHTCDSRDFTHCFTENRCFLLTNSNMFLSNHQNWFTGTWCRTLERHRHTCKSITSVVGDTEVFVSVNWVWITSQCFLTCDYCVEHVSQTTIQHGMRSCIWWCVTAWSFGDKSLLDHVN